MEAGLVAAAFSLATLALSRCRCILRRTESGVTEYGVGFTENSLLPDRPKPKRPIGEAAEWYDREALLRQHFSKKNDFTITPWTCKFTPFDIYLYTFMIWIILTFNSLYTCHHVFNTITWIPDGVSHNLICDRRRKLKNVRHRWKRGILDWK